MNGEPIPYVRLDEAALCGDCLVVFSVRARQCPTCGSEAGWFLLQRVETERRKPTPQKDHDA